MKLITLSFSLLAAVSFLGCTHTNVVQNEEQVVNHKIKINNEISTPRTYWSVLRPVGTNQNSKVPWIAKQTQSLSFCAKKTATKK